jgi:hypothetical protein
MAAHLTGAVCCAAAVSAELKAKMPRRIFTPAAVKIVRELAAQGKSSAQIADVIGSTPPSVRVKCCQLKIQLRRSGRPNPTWLDHREKLVLYMRPAEYAALKQKADHMYRPASELAGLLLEAVVSSNLYDAVLDDVG